MTIHLPESMEIRTLRRDRALVRAEAERDVLNGHFSTFMEPYDLGYCLEQVAPEAFNRTLREKPDIYALLNHSSMHPLARTIAKAARGKLAITIDDKGPLAEFEPTDTSFARDLLVNVDAGVIDAMSFGFDIRAEKWEKLDSGKFLYTLLDVDLWECSPVTFPANPATDLKSVRRSIREAQMREATKRRKRYFALCR